MKKNVLFLSPVHVQSGMGAAARSYYKSLELVSNLSCLPIIEGHEAHNSVEFNVGKKFTITQEHDVLIVHQNADAFDRILDSYGDIFNLSYKKKIAIWVWELENFQEQWLKYINMLDELWVPSNFVKNSIQKISNIKIHVVPHSIDIDCIEKTNYRLKYKIPQNAFLMGFFFDSSSYVERKNPLALIKAFNELSKEFNNLYLILKISHIHLFKNYLLTNNIQISDRVIFIEESMKSSELYGLIDELDCYVSPHRSEGFGLTIAEALAIGTTVVSTNYSGPIDFATHENSYPVDYDMVEIVETMGPYNRGELWSEIRQRELNAVLRRIIIGDKVRASKSRLAALEMKCNFSAKAISNIISEIL